MHGLLTLYTLILFALLINIPLGFLRQNYEKFTFGWYFYVHISIPVIVYLRIKSGFTWHIIPLMFASTVIGQFIGGRINRWKKR
jgi:hypothetical protein